MTALAPAITVCLTTYKRAQQLPATIESLLGQDFGNFELLIQDDASPDDTEEVCRAYERMDSRIRYQRNERNLGMPGNLNAVIARAQASYIANLHDGDLFRSDLLSRWLLALERHDAAFVFNQLEELDQERGHVRYLTHPFGERLEVGELVRYMLGRFASPVWGTVMARRAAYEAVGPFNPRYSFIADVEMWMRLNLRYPVAYVPEPLIRITPHEADRPYAYVNWGLERALVAMHEEIGDLVHSHDPVAAAAFARGLRRRRDRRWIRLIGSCARRRRLGLLSQGLAVFAQEDSLCLRAIAAVGRPAAWIARKLTVAPGSRPLP